MSFWDSYEGRTDVLGTHACEELDFLGPVLVKNRDILGSVPVKMWRFSGAYQ